MSKPTSYENFEAAFKQCITDGVHPSPSNINERLGRGRRNRLNGINSARRLKLMEEYNIPYQRDGAYGRKGQVPNRRRQGLLPYLYDGNS